VALAATLTASGARTRPSSLHAAFSVRMRCPVCAQDNLDMRCPHGVRFVADVSIGEVETLARAAGSDARHRYQYGHMPTLR
jgi:hypothetical protein